MGERHIGTSANASWGSAHLSLKDVDIGMGQGSKLWEEFKDCLKRVSSEEIQQWPWSDGYAACDSLTNLWGLPASNN